MAHDPPCEIERSVPWQKPFLKPSKPLSMEAQFCLSNRKTESQTISVKCLVTQLLSQFQPLAVTHKSFIINDVPADFYATADKNNLTAVISSLLNSIISRSSGSCIRLSAKRYNNIILF